MFAAEAALPNFMNGKAAAPTPTTADATDFFEGLSIARSIAPAPVSSLVKLPSVERPDFPYFQFCPYPAVSAVGFEPF